MTDSGSIGSPQRVLLMSEYFLPQKGGSVTWLANLYSRLAPHDVSVLAGTCENQELGDAAFPHPVARAPMSFPDRDPTVFSAMGSYWKLYRATRKVCRERRIQQIHCGKVLPEGWVAYWMHRLHGVPYVMYAHGEEITTSLLSRRLKLVLPLIYKGAAAVVANSGHTGEILESIGVPASRIHVIHPAVPAEQFEGVEPQGRELRARHGLEEDQVVLTVGRLQLRKGHDVAIKAMPKILQQHPRVKYVIVGSGEERDSLESLAGSLGVTDHVIFPGVVSDEELPAWYGACDVFLMPNRTVNQDLEGFGIVFLEAAAARRPSIAGSTGGTREAVVDGVTGLLVNGESEQEVARAVCELLGDRDRADQLGAAGRARVERDFTYDASAARLRRLTDELAG